MADAKRFFSGKTAIITGGSKGIGKAAAMEFVSGGGSVCIVARNKKDLQSAADEISKARASDTQTVATIACDTTDMKKLKPLIEGYIKKNGIPDYLMNFVGYAQPGYVQDYTLEDFKGNMETNYYGQLVPILIVLPHFMKRGSGYIVTCSSLLGYLGMIGYATYSPSKFAICGLTESLRSELSHRGIRFSILYPPDTDTPGFENENKFKPAEVMIMSETGGLLTATQVAQKLMRGIMKNQFYIHPGQSRLLWSIARHFPNLAHWIMDGEFKKAMKKLNNKK
ncbi:MAG: SDR family oxidoreductase [Spirochaetes bacterium]|nr:SDR family oxidoreductase [Spirochaetota bacterium]